MRGGTGRKTEDFCRRMPQEGGDEEKRGNKGRGVCCSRLLFVSGASVFTTMQYEIRFCDIDGVQSTKDGVCGVNVAKTYSSAKCGCFLRKISPKKKISVPLFFMRKGYSPRMSICVWEDGTITGCGGRPMKNYASCIISGLTWQDFCCPVVRA